MNIIQLLQITRSIEITIGPGLDATVLSIKWQKQILWVKIDLTGRGNTYLILMY